MERERPAQAPARSVATEVRSLMRAIIAVALVMLVLNIGSRIYLLAHLTPQVNDLRQSTQALDQLNAGMVDEETALRGYLATGSHVFLAPYDQALPTVSSASGTLVSKVPGEGLTGDLLAVEEARQIWADTWAGRALDPTQATAIGLTGPNDQQRRARLTAFLLSGKALFDRYRASVAQMQTQISAQSQAASAEQSDWLIWSGAVQAVIALGAVGTAFGARRRMGRRITVPVEVLSETVTQITQGDLDARVGLTRAPRELMDLGDNIDAMAARLAEQHRVAGERQAEVDRHAERLSVVLGAAREIAGSLSLRYVLRSVADAAQELGCARIRIWLADEQADGQTLTFDSEAGPQGPVGAVQVAPGTGLVGRAAMYGRPTGPEPLATSDGSALAVPLIVGGRVVGVLEAFTLMDSPLSGAAFEVLEVLATHAAGSVESARLHELTVEQAVTDALTRLPNRRAFEAEFPVEVDRALRYGRPLTVISLDLDHFKNLNDRYGHAYGDLALQQTSAALAHNIRETDRAFRLGGEELVVVCPETSEAEAVSLAERLRAAVEVSSGPDAPVVTASFGVAQLIVHASEATGLMAAADRALYLSKEQGRNRVSVATPVPGTPLQAVAADRRGAVVPVSTRPAPVPVPAPSTP